MREDGRLFDLLDKWWGEPESYLEYEAHRPRSGGDNARERAPI